MRISDWSSDVCSSDLVQVISAVAVLRRHTCTVPPSTTSEPRLHLVAHLVSVAANTTARLAVIVCEASVGACGRGRGNGIPAAHTRCRNSSFLVAVLVPQVVRAIAVPTHDEIGRAHV